MIEPDLITPAPYLNIPLFVAAQSSSQSERFVPSPHQEMLTLLDLLDHRIQTGYHRLSNGPGRAQAVSAHYEQCKSAIARIGVYWLGVIPGITVLEKRGTLGKATGAAMVSRHELVSSLPLFLLQAEGGGAVAF